MKQPSSPVHAQGPEAPGASTGGMTVRRHSEEVRRQAVARALIVGPKLAAKQMGLSVRTVANWWHDPRYTADLDPAARAHLAAELRETMVEALLRLRVSLRNPHARLGDVARAYEILRDSHALMSGEPTSRTETTVTTIDPQERRQMQRYIEGLLARLDAGEVDAVEAAVTTIEGTAREITKLLDSGEAVDLEAATAIVERRLS